jgi:hypothetical protein
MIKELERRTRAEFEGEPASALDYVEILIASGGTLQALADARARARGAHAMAERAIGVAEASTRDSAAADALLIRALQWQAERWNAGELGAKAGGVTVNVSIAQLSLDAMMATLPPEVVNARVIGERAQLTEDAQVVAIEDVSKR